MFFVHYIINVLTNGLIARGGERRFGRKFCVLRFLIAFGKRFDCFLRELFASLQETL